MSKKKRFIVHVEETRHYEFEVWAEDADQAREMGHPIWATADTVGEWELPDQETLLRAYAMPLPTPPVTGKE